MGSNLMSRSANARTNVEKYQPQTVGGLLLSAAENHPTRAFLRVRNTTLSYLEVDRESSKLANGLLKLGLRKGDRVLVLLEAGANLVIAWFAINKLGAVFVPINVELRADFLKHKVLDAQPKLVITGTDYLDEMLRSLPPSHGVDCILCRGGSDTARISDSGLNIRPLEAVALECVDPVPYSCAPEDLAMLIYTSGTTGVSKGCMVSHNYICNVARMVARAFGYVSDDVIWSSLPPFHISGASIVLSGAFVAAAIALEPRFSVSGFWSSIESTGATIANVPGAMIPLVGAAEDSVTSRRCYGRLRVAAGAPFSEEMKSVWTSRFGVRKIVVPSYGSTEAALITSTVPEDEAPPGAAGKLTQEFDLRIVDEANQAVPVGTPGEPICRPRFPHTMFEGYWNHPDQYQEVVKDGWFHTGDIGKLDENGYFYFLGRKKDYIRRRGENVSTFEVESCLSQHPDIQEVVVYGVPSPLGEEDVKVSAVKRKSSDLTEGDLFAWMRARLPRFALPSYIEFRQDLPRTATGKVMKHVLRGEQITPHTWRPYGE